MTTYPRVASAQFAVTGTEEIVTVNGVTFDWNPRSVGDMDAQAVMSILRHLRSVGASRPNMQLIWVESSPALEDTV